MLKEDVKRKTFIDILNRFEELEIIKYLSISCPIEVASLNIDIK